MKKVTLIFIFSMAIAAFANAQATRTWVSGVGDDVNPCSRTAPCKTFAGAISKTASPGIINCLDPGGMGAVTITKSITIDCTATLGSALSSGTQGIVINAQTTDKVVLRGLDINGAGVTLGTNGVNVIQAASVALFNVRIANYSGAGVETTNSSNQIALSLDNCQVLNNATGVLANSSGSGSTLLTVSNSQIENNTTGIDIEGPSSSAQVSHTIVSRNTGDGFKLGNGTSGAALDSSTFSFNGNGVDASAAGGTIRLSQCIVHANFTNGVTGAGTTKCFSNNAIAGNIGSNACSSPGNALQ
ncbi:MAG TPA: right-handed parallel beta-helix repeat-containing protein [Thermoanaerobaculia bacterium]|jgi:hypothetical protein|nr:right-handed parallel beta-helix repeat-containing protein [Thermoanaerobaculia bacterium]